MTAVLATLALLALVTYGLQVQHHRTRPLPGPTGSGPAVADRDTERVDADLAALDPTSDGDAGGRAAARARVGRTAHPVR
ncbi:hypothetical protein Lfu02_09730 [Longispora fulva]|uniref:Uncharacterized protein n=1 Tax=Longispora fulva TaxID=619741 RepID=A0A8J7GLF3_9ACTN|nr:hypothetical protein [Longispora fulva]MBG6135164.1 hypothetical protein [Longispora fulva]GIG56601.1 hypothetical protein Lfu02_09730 [Longispora fulva]